MTTPHPGRRQLATSPLDQLPARDQIKRWLYLTLAVIYALMLAWRSMRGDPDLAWPLMVCLSSLAIWVNLHSDVLPPHRWPR